MPEETQAQDNVEPQPEEKQPETQPEQPKMESYHRLKNLILYREEQPSPEAPAEETKTEEEGGESEKQPA